MECLNVKRDDQRGQRGLHKFTSAGPDACVLKHITYQPTVSKVTGGCVEEVWVETGRYLGSEE